MARDFGAERAGGRSDGVEPTAFVAVTLASLLLFFGCAAGHSLQATVGSWLGGTRAAEQRPRAYYAATARVRLHRAPDASSQVVGELALHEGVLRHKVDGGFAYVEAEKSGRSGWVRERDLIERLPAVPKPIAGTPADPVQPEQEESSAPDEPPDPALQPPEQPREKSVFDPY